VVALALDRAGHETWDRRIHRARQLADGAAARELLEFYARLLAFQKSVYRRVEPPSAAIDDDLARVGPFAGELGRLAASAGPALLAAEAGAFLELTSAEVRDRLVAWWRAPSDRDFFAKALLQPYAARLADAGAPPPDRGLSRAGNRCPFCAGAPQLSILDQPGESGGGRWLQCATCLTTWPFRRVLCPWCGEEDERRLGYFQADDLEHLRLDACDTCRRYLKSVDLTRNGLAVPLVDEVAGAALDVWARERDYEKIELNLVGL
jgi:FdhE protein